MKLELEQALKDAYPKFFTHLHAEKDDSDESEPPYSLTLFGLQCDDGWFTLIDSAAGAIEAQNDKGETVVRATQIKEKFGGLRIYTDISTDVARGATRCAELASKCTCEVCGESHSSLTRTDGLPRYKTLCDEHYAEMRRTDISEISVWKFTHECFNCAAEVPVVYPDPLGSSDGGTWNQIGPYLADKEYCTVSQTFSRQQRVFVWGNHCPECDAYLGNYFVRKDAQSRKPDEKELVERISLSALEKRKNE